MNTGRGCAGSASLPMTPLPPLAVGIIANHVDNGLRFEVFSPRDAVNCVKAKRTAIWNAFLFSVGFQHAVVGVSVISEHRVDHESSSM